MFENEKVWSVVKLFKDMKNSWSKLSSFDLEFGLIMFNLTSLAFPRFGKKSRPTMYDATPIAYEDYSPDDKPLVALIKTKDL